MKAKIHPKVNHVIFVDSVSGAEFIATSTLTSEETKKIGNIEYNIIKVEATSDTHPFYTGKQTNATKGDQVAKYLAKVAKAQATNKAKLAPKEEGEEKKAAKPAKAKKTK